jgi:pimeloyl-ACP methyl ester carboxylesterase
VSSKKIIAVVGAPGSQGGGLVRAILADPNGPYTGRNPTAMSDQVHFADTAVARLAYRIDGAESDVPLVLLQRFRGTIDDWDPAFISALAARRRVVRFDNVGIGRSEGETPDSVAEMATVVRAFLKSIEIDRADLLGWSLGGFIAQHVALDAPRLVRRLIIAASEPGGVSEGPQPDPRVPEIATKAENEDEDLLFLHFTPNEIGRAAGIASLKRIRFLSDKSPAVTMESFLRQAKAIATWAGVRSRLGELKVPTLVANGVSDVMFPAYRSYVISQEAPSAKLILYPDAGHGFLFQYIDDFAGEVERFLAA